jgi:sugar lactone lactonase YvrE
VAQRRLARLKPDIAMIVALGVLSNIGCQGVPTQPPRTGTAATKNDRLASGSPTPAPPLKGGVLQASERAQLGDRSSLPATAVRNKGGILSGQLLLPANLISNNSGGLISNNSGGLISNNAGGLVSHGGGNARSFAALDAGDRRFGPVPTVQMRQSEPRRHLLQADSQPVGGVTLVIVDAARRWVPDENGAPYLATTNAEGQYRFERTPTGRSFLLEVAGQAPGAGKAMAYLPDAPDGEARSVTLDAISTMTMTYITERYVKGNQATLEKLPGDVEAVTRAKLAASVDTFKLENLLPDTLVDAVEMARSANGAFNNQMRYVESLLVAGLSNLGEGLPALDVSLASPHRLVALLDGNLLVVENWAGRIRRISPDGRIFGYAGTVANLRVDVDGLDVGDGQPALKASLNSPVAIACDQQGNAYVCEWQGNRIRRIDAATGLISTVAGKGVASTRLFDFTPAPAGDPIEKGAPASKAVLKDPHAIAVDNAGRVLFAAKEGTFRVEPDGTLTPILHAGERRTPAKLAATAEGMVICDYGDQGFGRLDGDVFVKATDIPALPVKGNWHLAGGSQGIWYKHGEGNLHEFRDGQWRVIKRLDEPVEPDGLTANREYVWISSKTEGGVWRYTIATGAYARVAGKATDASAGVTGEALSLNRPSALAFDTQGRMLVSDGLNGIIWRRDNDQRYRRVAGNGTPPDQQTTGEETDALRAGIGVSTNLIPGRDGSLSFCSGSQYSYALRQVDASGRIALLGLPDGIKPFYAARDMTDAWIISDTTLSPLPSSRIVRVTGDTAEEIVPRKSLAIHYGLTVRPDGTLYFADILGSIVYKRSPDGKIQPVAGSTEAGGQFKGDGELATGAGLNWPVSLAFDANDNLYIADSQNHRIRRVDAKTGIITTLAGEGGSFFNGKGVDNGLREPASLAFDANGTLYIADTGHDQIKQIPADKLP